MGKKKNLGPWILSMVETWNDGAGKTKTMPSTKKKTNNAAKKTRTSGKGGDHCAKSPDRWKTQKGDGRLYKLRMAGRHLTTFCENHHNRDGRKKNLTGLPVVGDSGKAPGKREGEKVAPPWEKAKQKMTHVQKIREGSNPEVVKIGGESQTIVAPGARKSLTRKPLCKTGVPNPSGGQKKNKLGAGGVRGKNPEPRRAW